jgi:hypothetical protein
MTREILNMLKLNLPTIILFATVVSICPDLKHAHAQSSDNQVGKVCRVTDPTETPLNARLQPNGKIVNRIKNGKTVYIQSIARDDEDKPWVLVSIKDRGNHKILGYVLREFVSCY